MLVEVRPPGEEGRLLAVSDQGRWAAPEEPSSPEMGRGWWALPGLVDAHAHLAADSLELDPGVGAEIRRRAFACLERGTFLIVDKGWCDDSVIATLGDAPPTESPDLSGAGRMIAVPGGYYPGFAVETDPEGLARVVAEAVAEGRGWVKIVGDWPRKGQGAVSNFDEEALRIAVEVAHRGGARVAVHTMAPAVPTMAVRAGVDSIEHGLFLTPQDLDLLASRGGAWVPTILRMEAIAEMLGPGSSGGRLLRRGLDNVSSLLREVPDGVALLAGTDLATAPGDVAAEVVALVGAGLDAARAVAAASGTARAYLGRGYGFEVGEPADAVFYASDPSGDPITLQHPAAVLRAGKRLL